MTYADAQPEYPDGPDRDARQPGNVRRPGLPRPADDLDLLRSHPSLASLGGRGIRLDRVPAASTGVAFALALLASLLAFGVPGALLVVLALALALPLAGSALLHCDVVAARTVLRVARAALLGWVVVAALFLGSGSSGDSGAGPADRDPLRGVSVSEPASSAAGSAVGSTAGWVGDSATASGVHPAPLGGRGGRGGGSGKGGSGRHLVVGTT